MNCARSTLTQFHLIALFALQYIGKGLDDHRQVTYQLFIGIDESTFWVNIRIEIDLFNEPIDDFILVRKNEVGQSRKFALNRHSSHNLSLFTDASALALRN